MANSNFEEKVSLVVQVKGDEDFRRLSKVISDQNAALRNLGVEYNRVSGNISKAGVVSKGWASSMGGAGTVTRNVSAQIADFAVQIQGGQSAMLAFSQQAPQLLASFGAIGGAVAAVLAVTVALPALKALFGALADSAKPLRTAFDELDEAMKRVGETGHDFKLDSFIEEFNAADAGVRKSMLSVLEWQREIAKLKDEQSGKSTQQGIQEQLIPGVGEQSLRFLKGVLAQDEASLIQSLDAFGNDFAGAQNTLVDGLKVSEEAAAELLLRLNQFKDLPESEMRNVITLFEKANNTRFDELLKDLYRVRDAQIAVADQQKKTNEALNKGKEALKTGGTIPTGKDEKSGKIPQVLFNNEQLEKNERLIKRIREELGLTREQAAGIAGNLFHESAGFNTGAISKDGHNSIGLAQWTADRRKQLESFASSVGKASTDFDTQTNFLIKELNTTERKTLDRIKNTKGVEDATKVFQDTFERPDPKLAHTDRRIAAAQTAFLGGLTESERKKEISDLEKYQNDIIAQKQKFADTIAKIDEKGSVRTGSELQQKIVQEQLAAYKSAGIGLGELTAQEREYKAVLDEKISSQIKDAEATKLQESQLQALNTVLDGKTYEDQLIKIRQALDDGVISTGKFVQMSNELSQSFNASVNALSAINNFKIDLTEQQKEFDQLDEKIKATQELLAQGKISPQLGQQTLDSLRSQISPVEAFKVDTEAQARDLTLIQDKIRATQNLSALGLISPKAAQETIINLRGMAGEFDNTSGRFVDLMEGEMGSAIDGLVDALHGAKFSFTDFVDSMIKDITKFLLKEQLTEWFKSFREQGNVGILDGLTKGGGGSSGSSLGGLGGLLGGLFSSGSGGGNTFQGNGPLLSYKNTNFADYAKDGMNSVSDGLSEVGDSLSKYASTFMSLFSSFAAKGNAYSQGNLMPFAKGGVFDNGNVIEFARGGVINSGNIIPFAKGGIFDAGNIIKFANGGVVTRPTMFGMSNGRMGVMGEGGSPEAILPLQRRGGVLGVRATGTGGSTHITVNQNISVGQGANRDMIRQSAAQGARQGLGFMGSANRYR